MTALELLALALLILGAACWIDAAHPTERDNDHRGPTDGR